MVHHVQTDFYGLLSQLLREELSSEDEAAILEANGAAIVPQVALVANAEIEVMVKNEKMLVLTSPSSKDKEKKSRSKTKDRFVP